MAKKEKLTQTELVQKAWKERKRTIEIDGVRCSIERRDRKVSFESGGETVKTTEKWLIVKPLDGSLVPHMQVELKPMCNLRTQMA